ncbi:MAG: transglutaminase N-terminal domain-containing protein, partial [Alphaproteobacteria bacterium]
MRIKILHKTTYLYNKNVPRLSQSLRLYPTECKNQSIINWSINVDRGKIKYLYKDSLGHRTYSLTNKNIEGVQNII